MKARNTLIAFSIKYRGDWDSIMKALCDRESIETEYLEQAEKIKCKTVTMVDLDYPPYLKAIRKAPFVLYYYGDLSIIQDYHKNVSVVGSRNYSEYGKRKTEEIVDGLVQSGFNIISGMAIGIDTIAHQQAINSKGKTVAILGSGIDFCYPPSNLHLYEYLKRNHLVISEYPGSLEPQPYYFPIRNRIIAGLSKTLVVTEAKYNSGSLITATLASKGNADVMCVPYEADKESECNRLIKNGAFLVENVEDILEQMSAF